MFACGTANGEYIVERHREVGDNDLPHRLTECLAWCRAIAGLTFKCIGSHGFIGEAVGLQLTPHLPRHPQQEQAPRQEQTNNAQQLLPALEDQSQ